MLGGKAVHGFQKWMRPQTGDRRSGRVWRVWGGVFQRTHMRVVKSARERRDVCVERRRNRVDAGVWDVRDFDRGCGWVREKRVRVCQGVRENRERSFCSAQSLERKAAMRKNRQRQVPTADSLRVRSTAFRRRKEKQRQILVLLAASHPTHRAKCCALSGAPASVAAGLSTAVAMTECGRGCRMRG